MRPPAIMISIDSWMGAAFALGFLIPLSIAALAGGYILGTYVLDRFSKTVLGTHVRHFFTRLAPAKRFHPGDEEYVERVIVDALKRHGSRVREALRRG
jgi:hypothetical protein